MGDAEDGGFFIPVEGDDFGGFFHAGAVLDGAADAAGDVEGGADGGAGLADLVVFADEAGVDGGAAGAHGGAEDAGEVVDEFEVGLGADAPAAGDDDAGGLEVDFLFLAVAFDEFDGHVEVVEFDFFLDDSAGAGRVAVGHAHDAFADGGHLGPAVVVDDGGDDVAAEGGTDLVEEVGVEVLGFGIGVLADLEVGAVGGETGAEFGGDARGEVAAEGGGAVEDDLGAVLADQFAGGVGVGEGAEMLETAVVDVVDVVDTARDEQVGEFADVAAEEDGADLDAEGVGEFAGLAAELESGVGEAFIFLFSKEPDFALGVRINHVIHPYLGVGQSVAFMSVVSSPWSVVGSFVRWSVAGVASQVILVLTLRAFY